ncbi:MAG: hypothetical protein IJW98_03505, partial [Clostridia bacterium]|nr:hypothetical protein [Clostridia bacterium]
YRIMGHLSIVFAEKIEIFSCIGRGYRRKNQDVRREFQKKQKFFKKCARKCFAELLYLIYGIKSTFATERE